MSSQPLTELQLFFLFQAPFTFFLSFPLLFPNLLLFLSFSRSVYFSPSSPFSFLSLIIPALSSQAVFSHVLLCPMPHPGGSFGKPFSLPGVVLWLVLALALLSPVLAETSACRTKLFSGSSPMLFQLS